MNSSKNQLDRLTELVSYANLPLDGVLKDFENMTKQKILKEQHKYKIFYSEKTDSWYTYLPDDSKPNHRRQIKRKSREHLENAIINFYLAKEKEKDIRNQSLKEWYSKWMIYRRDYTPAKPKTILENYYDWKLFFEGTDLAEMPLCEIRPIVLIRFFRRLTKDRKYTHKRVSNARSVLNGIMTFAVEEEAIEHNPVVDVNLKNFTYKPVEDQSDNVFSKKDTITLLKYLRNIDEPYSLAIQLSFYLFIRVGETKGLRWQDIDFDAKTIKLRRQVTIERQLNDDLTFGKREVVVYEQMKGNTSQGFRTQYLTEDALFILKKAKLLSFDSIYIFAPNGQPMTTDSFNRRLKKYCKEAGVPYYSSHKIRFYNASTAYDGKNLVTISKLMGHSQVQTTLHYLRNVQEQDTVMQSFSQLGLQTS